MNSQPQEKSSNWAKTVLVGGAAAVAAAGAAGYYYYYTRQQQQQHEQQNDRSSPNGGGKHQKLSALRQGSDVRGVAIATEDEPVTLTLPVVKSIAQAFATFICETQHKNVEDLRISVGRDSRVSGPDLTETVLEGLCDFGVDCADFGLASTPAMFMSTATEGYNYDGAIMVTASHLPWNRNGLKFFVRETGGLGKSDIKRILRLAESILSSSSPSSAVASSSRQGQVLDVDFMQVYVDHLVNVVRRAVVLDSADSLVDRQKPLEGYHILVDAGNGAGGFFVQVLERLGANTAGSQYLEPDGLFPNHIPNPEDASAIEATRNAVLANGADLGIVFDTDVDRAGLVSHSGEAINRNRFIALMASIVLQEHPHTTVVTDSVTSEGLTRFIEQRGGKHHRFRRGYKNVIDEAVRLNGEGIETHLAIETSGHGALKENYFLDDGAYQVIKVLVLLARTAASSGKRNGSLVTDLIQDLQEAPEASEFRLPIQAAEGAGGESHQSVGQKVIDALTAKLSENPAISERLQGTLVEPNYEGVRVRVSPSSSSSSEERQEGGWFLLRLSLHDPLLVLNLESSPAASSEQQPLDASVLGSSFVDISQQPPAVSVEDMLVFLRSFFMEFPAVDASRL